MNKMRLSSLFTAFALLLQLSIFQSITATAADLPLLLLDYTEIDDKHFEVVCTVENIPVVDVICLPIAYNSSAVAICGYNPQTGEFFDIEDGVKTEAGFIDGSNGVVLYDEFIGMDKWGGVVLENALYPFINNRDGIMSSAVFSMNDAGFAGKSKIMSVYFKRIGSGAPQIRIASYKNTENYDPAAKDGASFVSAGANVDVQVKYSGDVFDSGVEVDLPEDGSIPVIPGGTSSPGNASVPGSSASSSGSNNSGASSKNETVKTEKEEQPVIKEEAEISFADVINGFWAAEYIVSLAGKKIINGYSDNTFKPNNNITRAELAKITVLAKGLDATENANLFKDVKSSSWYAPYLTAAYNNNIINGYPDNTFKPEVNVSRQDLCLILYRAFFEGKAAESAVSFADDDKISAYAKTAVNYLASMGIVNGKGGNKFAPTDNATRAETAKIVYLCMEKAKA